MIRLLFVGVAALLGGYAFPWWWPAVPGLVAGFWKPRNPWAGFLLSALGAALAWASVALFFDVRNHGLLSGRVAPLLHLPGSAGLVAAAALAGGVTAGLGSLVGSRFRLFWRSLNEALAAEDILLPPDENFKP